MSKTDRIGLSKRVLHYGVQLRSARPFLIGGAPASSSNLQRVERMFEAWLFLIEDLMLRLELSESSRDRRMQNFVYAFLHTDLLDSISFFDSIYQALLGRDVNLETFKQSLDSLESVPIHYRGLLSPVNGFVYPFLTEADYERKADLLASISQFLRFPRKLELQDIGLELNALQEYEETEEYLASVEYGDHEMINSLKDIITKWFRDFHIENLLPTNGPGSVAEGSLTLAEKFNRMSIDKKIKILLSNCSEGGYTSYFPVVPKDDLVRTSRTIFVPKTASKLRTISMEPVALQYIQQGVMYELYRYIEQHPYLGVHVRLRDQQQNQIWAQIGSSDNSYCTMDLSKASDTVSWTLVKQLFKGVPRLYKWLLGTRSTSTLLPDGRVLQLKKYAPMGSALCFPLECIIFSSVVELALRRSSIRARPFDWFWSVYGDDLVFPSHIYSDVRSMLTSLGFIVNEEKSFHDGPYRESCGKEYYAGVDITPLYYRIPFYEYKVTPSAYGAWCSSANNAFYHRLPSYRLYLLRKILRFARKNGPYFVDTPEMSPFLFSPQATNFHVKARWSKDYQRNEGRFLSAISRPRSEELDDDALRYHVELVRMARRSRDTDRCHRPDESSFPSALTGCVEQFSSRLRPILPFKSIRALNWECGLGPRQ